MEVGAAFLPCGCLSSETSLSFSRLCTSPSTKACSKPRFTRTRTLCSCQCSVELGVIVAYRSILVEATPLPLMTANVAVSIPDGRCGRAGRLSTRDETDQTVLKPHSLLILFVGLRQPGVSDKLRVRYGAPCLVSRYQQGYNRDPFRPPVHHSYLSHVLLLYLPCLPYLTPVSHYSPAPHTVTSQALVQTDDKRPWRKEAVGGLACGGASRQYSIPAKSSEV